MEWNRHSCLKTNSETSAEARLAKYSDGKIIHTPLMESNIPGTHGPSGNCIPARVNQEIKDVEISQWPL